MRPETRNFDAGHSAGSSDSEPLADWERAETLHEHAPVQDWETSETLPEVAPVRPPAAAEGAPAAPQKAWEQVKAKRDVELSGHKEFVQEQATQKRLDEVGVDKELAERIALQADERAQRQQQANVQKEIDRLHARDTQTKSPVDRVKEGQIVDLRQRELRLQAQIDALPWYARGRKKELRSSLGITVERLNGLTASTPEMRKRQRDLARKTSTPIAPMDARPTHIQARDRMKTAATERNNLGFFAKLFKTKSYTRAQSKTLGASGEYGGLLRAKMGEVSIPQEELDALNKHLDKAA